MAFPHQDRAVQLTTAEAYLRDLGALVYLQEHGRAVPPGERERILASLEELETAGVRLELGLHTASPTLAETPPDPGGLPRAPRAGALPPGIVPAVGAPAQNEVPQHRPHPHG